MIDAVIYACYKLLMQFFLYNNMLFQNISPLASITSYCGFLMSLF